MSEQNTIKKMVSQIMRGRKNASFDRHIMHPEREWFVIVFVGLMLFAMGIAWNVSTHLQFKNVSVADGQVAEETLVYRASLVESALSDFEKRKQQYQELKQELMSRQVVVPTLPEASNTTTEGQASSTQDSVPGGLVPTEDDSATEIPEESVVLPPSDIEESITDQPVI